MNLLGRITNFENICFGSHGREGVSGLVWDAPGAVQALQPLFVRCPGQGWGCAQVPSTLDIPFKKGI